MNSNNFYNNQPPRNNRNFSNNFCNFNQKPSMRPSFRNAMLPPIYPSVPPPQVPTNNFNMSKPYDNNQQQKSRFNPYYGRHFQNNFHCASNASNLNGPSLNSTFISTTPDFDINNNTNNASFLNSSMVTNVGSSEQEQTSNIQDGVILQISNLDPWHDESSLRNYLLSQLKPITPVLSLMIESPSLAKVKVPSQQFAKLVVSHLHRKKFGHKRMIVSYLRDQTSAETSALRCQVTGLLKDVPFNSLPMCKFRELFQSRFKSSISVLDLYRMSDICAITVDGNEEKFISLQPELVNSNENNSLIELNQHSAPYCIYHFKADTNKGWAEIEIDPLPNVFLSLTEVQSKIFLLLKSHPDDIPIASLLYCIEGELGIKITPNDRGISLEHLVSCVQGVQIKNNNYGIKVLAWSDDRDNFDDESSVTSSRMSVKSGNSGTSKNPANDSLSYITKEVIELIKMSPKSTMKFNKFIPAYHNHFGKQCRVADYGYTKLIELFEALSTTVQIMGDGENRLITLTHRTQIRRFTTDLLKIIRSNPNKQIQLSELPQAYYSTFNRQFTVTDYGVCHIDDLLDGLRYNNSIVVQSGNSGENDVILYIQKRKQTIVELEKASVFAGEVVELLRNAPQYSVLFRKFVRSYHYYFGYQCRLSDYGFSKLTELLEAINGVVEMEQICEENRRIFLSSKIALRVFSEQIQEIIKSFTEDPKSMIKVDDLMKFHKTKFGYQMQPQTLGFENIIDALKSAPYVEITNNDNELWIMSHCEDEVFRQRSYMACLVINAQSSNKIPLQKFFTEFAEKFKFNLNEKTLYNMKHAVEVEMVNGTKMISVTPIMKFITSIVNILLKQKRVWIHELKDTLKIGVTTCFTFGFPNVSSLIQAFPDIFAMSSATNMHERSEIELNRNCVFYSSGLKKIQELKSPEKPPKFVPSSQQALFNQKPSNQSQPTSNSNRVSCNLNKYFNAAANQSKPSFDLNNNNSNMKSFYPTTTSNSCQSGFPLSKQANNGNFMNRSISDEFGRDSFSQQLRRPSFPQNGGNSFYQQNQAQLSQSYQETVSQSLYNHYQQQLNCTYPQYRGSQEYNPHQLSQPQKLFERRNVANPINLNPLPNYQQIMGMHQQQQQQMIWNQTQQQNESFNHSTVSNSSVASSTNANNYDYNSLEYLAKLYRLYDPPKPDTPQEKVMPFWSDPVWGFKRDTPQKQTAETLNINLPDLKTFNVLPIIMSPFPISSMTVNNKSIFTFDENNNVSKPDGGVEKSIN